MFGLFKRHRAIAQVRIVERDRCRVSLDEWRSTPDMVKLAQSYLNDPKFRLILDVLRNEHPAGVAMFDVDIAQRAVQQAKIEGYELALNTLEKMGELIKVQPEIESEFKDPATYEQMAERES